MKDNRCMVCKYLGDHNQKELCLDRIYRERGSDITVPLCYFHSWELFRMGQRPFLGKYRHNFMDFFGTETEAELIEYVKGSAQKTNHWAA